MKKAFTLIELLVVIAIIAILAAILFPVFARAKQAAKSTGDLAQAKQIGTSLAMYLSDYEDTMPIFYAYNSDQTLYAPIKHKGIELLLNPYMKSPDMFKSAFDTGSPYLASDPGLIASGSHPANYYEAYGTSYRFDHCMFSTVQSESSQNNSFSIYDYVSDAFNQTHLVTWAGVNHPSQTRMIRLEMMPWFSAQFDPGCATYGYDCGGSSSFFKQWDSSGGPVIYTDSHAKHLANAGQFDNDRVNPEGNLSGEKTSNPNAWSGTWYSLCD